MTRPPGPRCRHPSVWSARSRAQPPDRRRRSACRTAPGRLFRREHASRVTRLRLAERMLLPERARRIKRGNGGRVMLAPAALPHLRPPLGCLPRVHAPTSRRGRGSRQSRRQSVRAARCCRGNQRWSAGDDDCPVSGGGGEPGQVLGITGQDPVSGLGQQDDGSIDRSARPARPSRTPAWRPSWWSTARTSTARSSRARFAWRPCRSRHTWATTIALLRNSAPRRWATRSLAIIARSSRAMATSAPASSTTALTVSARYAGVPGRHGAFTPGHPAGSCPAYRGPSRRREVSETRLSARTVSRRGSRSGPCRGAGRPGCAARPERA